MIALKEVNVATLEDLAIILKRVVVKSVMLSSKVKLINIEILASLKPLILFN